MPLEKERGFWQKKGERGSNSLGIRFSSLSSSGGETGVVLILQILESEVGINLGGVDGGMSQKLLDQAEIGPILEKVSREGVADFVRVEGEIGSDFLFDFVEDVFEASNRQSPTSVV